MARREAARRKAPEARCSGRGVAPPRPSAAAAAAPGGRVTMTITAEAVKALRERTGAGMMECKKALVETNGDLEAAAEVMRKSGLAKADKKAGRIAAEGVIAVERSADGKAVAVVEVNSETDFVAREKDFQAFATDVAAARARRRARPTSSACWPRRLPSGETVEEARRALVARIGENIGVRRFEVVTSSAPLGDLPARQPHRRAGRPRGRRRHARPRPRHARGRDQPAVPVARTRCRPSSSPRSGRSRWPRRRPRPRARSRARSSPRWSRAGCASPSAEITLLGQPFVKDPETTVEKLLKKANARVLRFVRYEVGAGIEKKQDNFAAEVMAQVGAPETGAPARCPFEPRASGVPYNGPRQERDPPMAPPEER